MEHSKMTLVQLRGYLHIGEVSYTVKVGNNKMMYQLSSICRWYGGISGTAIHQNKIYSQYTWHKPAVISTDNHSLTDKVK